MQNVKFMVMICMCASVESSLNNFMMLHKFYSDIGGWLGPVKWFWSLTNMKYDMFVELRNEAQQDLCRLLTWITAKTKRCQNTLEPNFFCP